MSILTLFFSPVTESDRVFRTSSSPRSVGSQVASNGALIFVCDSSFAFFAIFRTHGARATPPPCHNRFAQAFATKNIPNGPGRIIHPHLAGDRLSKRGYRLLRARARRQAVSVGQKAN